MVPRRRRLPAERFRELRGRATFPGFVVRYGLNGLSVSRHAVVAGLKVDKRSSRRHTLKRVILGEAEQLQAGADCLWLVAPQAKKVSREELRAHARGACEHIRKELLQHTHV